MNMTILEQQHEEMRLKLQDIQAANDQQSQ